jgi:KUP system potassium uptake protein
LYAVKEIFFSHAHLEKSPENVLGVISLVIWAITLIVSVKYVLLVLRADSQGEGGVFALFSLLKKFSSRFIGTVSVLLILAAGLLFGDGIITPAISVISAVEGLSEVTTAFTPYVVPITVAILTGLFLIQSRGTHKIGAFFGPIVMVWFVAIGLLGGYHITTDFQILAALNPWHAMTFIMHTHLHTLMLVLGSVMLVVTGGEAMYADMGHFGRQPIRISWFAITYPALILNYLGQGAYLLMHPQMEHGHLFFAMVPEPLLIPMVILATLATIIASQALITGAFSLASQAVALGLMPYLKTIHTNEEHHGQIYIPAINWLLYVGCIALVVSFRSSTALASAYGLAVSGVMLVTSLGMLAVAQNYWGWSWPKVLAIFIPFVLIDMAFLEANSLKFFEGGYVPLSIGVVVLGIMLVWEWGRGQLKEVMHQLNGISIQDLIDYKKQQKQQLPKSIIVLVEQSITKLSQSAPTAKSVFLRRYGILPRDIIFLKIKNIKQPHLAEEKRYEVISFMEDKKYGSVVSVTVKTGFMESIDLEAILEKLASQHLLHISDHHRDWLVHEIKPHFIFDPAMTFFKKIKLYCFGWLYNSTEQLERYNGLGSKVQLSLEVIPVKVQ